MLRNRLNQTLTGSLLLIASLVIVGCRPYGGEKVAEYEPNLVYAYQLGERSEQSFDEPLQQTTQAVHDLFGTPDEPKLPEFLTELDEDVAAVINMDHVMTASGPPNAEGRGLYRKHCATCHGVTGNGRGPTAALLNPYPRDYRLGRFKFKSTPIGTKPAKSDIAYVIKNGIPGSSMVKIPELTDEDIEALVDYVVFLSWRGEVERSLLLEASFLDFTDPEEPEAIYTPALKDSADEDDQELWEEQWELVQDFVLEAGENWLDAEDSVAEVPERDETVVPDTFEQVLVAMQSESDSPVKQSVLRGKDLFLSEKAACAKCHGKEGKGDGTTDDYDEWTKDWTQKFNLDPLNEELHVPLIARGALPVRKVAPRNFHEGIFRGGDTPEKLYQRVALGIEGTPMPAASVGPDQIWDIVNFVRSLYDPTLNPQVPSTQASMPSDDEETAAQRGDVAASETQDIAIEPKALNRNTATQDFATK